MANAARAASNECDPAPVRWPALQGEVGVLVGLRLRGKGDLLTGVPASLAREALLGEGKVGTAGRAGVMGGWVPEDEARDELEESEGDRSRSGVSYMSD